MGTKHTPGPLVKERCPGFSWHDLISEKEESHVGKAYDVMEGDGGFSNARLLAAAYNSYDKHCGERAVECAEQDLLGELIRIVDRYIAHDEMSNITENGLYKDAVTAMLKVGKK